MKASLFIVAFLAVIYLAPAQTPPSSPTPVDKSKAKAFAIFAPPPKYPVDAQGQHPTGRGIVLMEVDRETGWVTSAKMQKSTGNKLLDDAALEAFSRWRFKPGTVRHIHSPITFTNRGRPRSNQTLQPTAGRAHE